MAKQNLFGSNKTESKNDLFDKQCAIKLQGELIAHKLLQKPARRWEVHFRQLRIADKIPRKRILAALEWLLGNLKAKYTPVVRSAKSFRAKFPAIEEAMRREPAAPDTEIKITDAARWVQDKSGQLIYPLPAHKEEELRTIQLSLNNYAEFLSRLRRLEKRELEFSCARDREKYGPNSRRSSTAHWTITKTFQWMLSLFPPDPRDFVLGWTLEIHRHLWRLQQDDFPIPKTIARYAFRFESPKFQRNLKEMLANWTDDEKMFDTIVEKIRNEN